MNEFTASNGARFEEQPDGRVIFTGGILDAQIALSPGMVFGLREFFQHERDEELGRWRWPENPDYVVYPRGESGVHVLDEGSGIGAARFIHRDGDPDNPTAEYQAAYAYFEAHPERKPWHDAKPGEAWELTFSEEGGGGPDVWIVHKGMTFRNPEYVSKVPLNDSTIISGRRIWPEDAS